MLRLMTLQVLLIGSSGCIMWLTDTPPVSGKVLSKSTGEPVSDAKVSITPDVARAPKVRASTGADGGFSLPGSRKLMVVPIGDHVNGGVLTVEHPKYQKWSEYIGAMARRIDLERPIHLKPLR